MLQMEKVCSREAHEGSLLLLHAKSGTGPELSLSCSHAYLVPSKNGFFHQCELYVKFRLLNVKIYRQYDLIVSD